MEGTSHPTQRSFNPYSENGGTILAVAGADFCVIAGDTRQTQGYSIQTRYAPKVFRLYVFPMPTCSSLVVLFFLAQNRQGRTCCKRFRCRREHVRQESPPTFRGVYTILVDDLDPQRSMLVVSPRSCKRYANSCHRTSYSNNALCTPFLPILRLQYSRGNRG